MSFMLRFAQHWGKEIHRDYDEHGPVRVMDDGSKRYLVFDSIHEQSCQLKDQPALLVHEYGRAMMIPLAFHEPRRVLLCGLGGGSLVHCLFRHFPEVRLDVVELRPRVVEVAYRFFQLPYDPRIRIHAMDAGDYLRQSPDASYDFILSDIFHASCMDSQQAEQTFLAHCHRLLTPDGWLAINYSSHSECSHETLRFISTEFADIRTCGVPSGNLVLLACKSPVRKSEKEITDRLKALNKLLGFSLSRYFGRVHKIKG